MNKKKLSKSESEFLVYLRSLAIFIIVFGHVGGFWILRPYSEFLHVFVPVFFFISGAVSFYSFNRSINTIEYYIKRVLGLLVPYYLLCIVSLLFFIATEHTLPDFNIINLLKWIQIRPSNDIMPFPIGQVWFLHTLFIITIISPLYFKLYSKNEKIIYIILFFIISFSTVPFFFNINDYLSLGGNNLYKPLIHSSFYIFGMLVFSSEYFKKNTILVFILISSALISFLTKVLLNLNIDYAFHIFSPDLYYISGSFCAISLILITKKIFMNFVNKSVVIKSILYFFYKHTFSIYLLHSLGIWISENIFGLVHPSQKGLIYGLIKLVVVLIVTCLLAIPYTKLSQTISTSLLSKMKVQSAISKNKL